MAAGTGALPAIEIVGDRPTGRFDAVVIGVDGRGEPVLTPRWLAGARRAALRAAARLFPPGAEAGAIAGPVPDLGPAGEPGYLVLMAAGRGRAAKGSRGGTAAPVAPDTIGHAIAGRLAADGHERVLLVLSGAVLAGERRRGARGTAAGDGPVPGPAEGLARVLLGASLAGYRFDFRTRGRPDDPARLKRLALVAPQPASVRRAWAAFEPDLAGIGFARDLVNEPGNRIYPASFAARLRTRLRPHGIAVEILTPGQLERLGMGALLAVGRGSAHSPRLVVMRWPGRRGSGRGARPVALVGKGVTFDTGGIDIKPAAKMEQMKGDMAGAAAVAGSMLALALRRHPAPVVGVAPLVENMPSGRSYRPGDVVRSHEGKTIEIIDTDAEGRLILADALAYAVGRFRPRAIVDLATLTGSVIAALGHLYAGIFANDDALSDALIAAGRKVGERLWRLPLDPDYAAHLKSGIADIRQVAPDEESADAVHAAQFLQAFVGHTPWAHLDIAGVEYLRGDRGHGASGFAVRLLTAWLAGTGKGAGRRH